MITTFVAFAAIVSQSVGSPQDMLRPEPPKAPNSSIAVNDYLRSVRNYIKNSKKAGHFDEETEEWAEEQFEFYGMRSHLLQMRAGSDGLINTAQYQAAIEHKKHMEPELNMAYVGTGWNFIGPRQLDSSRTCQSSPVTGRVNAVAYNPADANDWWVCGATGGLFKTTDNGSTFNGFSDKWDYTYTSAIAIDPTNSNRVYVATGDYPGWWGYGMGLMRTTNGGASWVNELKTELQGCEISDVMIDPDDPSIILVTAGRGTDDPAGQGIWRSTDYGANWSRVKSVFGDSGFAKLTSSIKTNGVRNLYASHGSLGYVYRSRDDGATWQNISPSGTGLVSVAASHKTRDAVYAYRSTGSILMSNDAGATWSSITRNLGNITDIDSDFRQTGYNYAFGVMDSASDGSGSEILVFGAVDCFALVNPFNGSTQWQWINGAPNTLRLIHSDYHGFDQHPSIKNVALVSTDGGVWQLLYFGSGFGFVWTNKNASLRLTEHVFTAPHPDASTYPNYVNTGMWHLGCAYSPNNVNTWTGNYGGDGMWTAIDDSNPQIQYAQNQSANNDGETSAISVGATDDAWATRTDLSTSTSLMPENWAFAAPFSEIPGDTGALYFAGERLYKLKWTGGSPTWTKSIGNVDFSSDSTEYATAIEAVSGGGCFVGTVRGRFFASLTPSSGMTMVHDFVGAISSIKASPTDSDDVLISIGGVEAGGPNRSGALWEVLDSTSATPTIVDRSGSGTNSLPGIGVNWIERDPYDPGFTWYAATDIGVFYTRDRGANWFNASEPLGLPNALVYQLEVSDNQLYASTFGRGIWRMQLYPSAPTLSSLTFQNSEVHGGKSTPATMVLSREAPPGGLDIPVTSNNLSLIPTQIVHFPGGAISATVYVDTKQASSDATVTVTANYGGPKSDTIIVRSYKVVDLVLPNIVSGNSDVGLVYLDDTAPSSGILVDLSDNDLSTVLYNDPVNVVGGVNVAFFTIDTSIASADRTVTVTANAGGGNYSELFTRYGIRVNQFFALVNIVWNTQNGVLSYTLNHLAPSDPFTLQLSSSDPASAQVPATFTMPEGQSSANIPVTTSYVPVDKDVTITATDPYGTTYQAVVTVRHIGVQSLTFNFNPVVGGNPVTGTVTLDRNVGLAPINISLSSALPSVAQVPGFVTMPYNSQTATFPVATNTVHQVYDVPITATIGSQLVVGAYQTANLRVLPDEITVAPSSFTATLGQVKSGNVASLAARDGDVMRICKAFVPNLTVYPVTVQIDGTSPIGSCTGIRLSVYSRIANGGSFIQTLEPYNWTAGTWDTTDVRTDNLTLSLVDRELVGTGNLSRWLRSDGALRARFKAKLVGFSAVAVWCYENDSSVWKLNP